MTKIVIMKSAQSINQSIKIWKVAASVRNFKRLVIVLNLNHKNYANKL